MEDFKDVMLSEPPQRYAAPVSHTNASNALSLESYKGILLCDRPADTRANRAAQQNPPFLPPGNTDMDRGNGNLGLQPSLESRSKIGMSRGLRSEAHRTQHPPTALSKHRRWLSSFASEVKKMQQSKEDQLQATKAKMAAIRDREAAKRRGEGTLVTSDAPAVADVEPSKKPPTPPPATSSLPPIKKAASNKAASGKSKAKPRWAMTEEEAEDAEFAEARDLMDFAAELDFESFIKDFEVQEALAIMRDRVKEIAAEKGIDLEAARQARAANDEDNDDTMSIMTVSTTTGQPKKVHRTAKQQAKKMSERDENGDTIGDRPSWDDSTGNAIRGALQSDALKLAERVLQSSDALRKVHSKMSMARLLQDVAMELNVPAGTMRSVMMPAESSMPHPIVSVVAAEATGAVGSNGNFTTTKRVLTEMRHSKTKVQNLPYLYRCPSI